MSKVIITDCDHENIDIEKRVLESASIPFSLMQCRTEDDLVEQGGGASVFINQYAPITERVLSSLPELKLIVRYGVGVNNIDLEAASKYGVQVCNVPDYGTNEVADHALALMLSLTRKINLMNGLVRKGIWDYQKSIPIFRHSEQTVGIIGVGRIGRAFAEKAHAMKFKIVAYDPNFESRQPNRVPEFIKLVSLKELLEISDVVSIHCPLDTAYHLIGEAELKLMKRSAFLVNVSRGGIIEENALLEALENKWIAGAAVDVTEKEPLPSESPLLKCENFICTPHMAWYSEQSAQELKRKVAEEAVRYLDGEEIRYPVNQIKINI